MKNNNGKSSHGQPIRGSLKPIENTPLDHNFQEIIKSSGVANIVLIQKCRDEFKKVVARYLDHAAKLCNSTIKISEESKAIFYQTLQQNTNHSVCNFANCCINYFNTHNNNIEVDLSGPECGAKFIDKAFQQARKNAEKIVKQRINKIIKKMENNNWSNVPEILIIEYKGIASAVNSVCIFISAIANGKLPSQITVDLYNSAIKKDKKIKEYYKLIPELNIYRLIKKNKPKYSSICQECATLIICKTKEQIFIK